MEETRENRLKLIILLLGIFTISFGIITFEISLTRILSVMFSYHYTFLAVSLALFGLGLGGALTQIFHKKISADKAFGTLALTCSISSLTPLFFAFILVSAPGSNIISDSLIVFFPFLIAGVLMATIYKVFVSLSNALYFADLSGAAVGALAASFMLNLGASKVILLASIFIAIASLFFALTSKRKTIIVVASASIILLGFLAKYPISVNPLDISQEDEQEKELAMILGNQLLGAKIVDTRWSAFGRTDLVELESDPHEKWIFVDGSAGTRMYHFDGNFSSSNSEVPSLKYTTQFYPYYFAGKANSLVIGPGGGLDILTSLMGGMNHTTAVEVNQDIVNIVRDYSEYNGGIYTRYSNVHVYVDEGRSFIRRSTQKYDIIMLNIPITKTSQGTVGYALAENYLFTTDSHGLPRSS